MGRHVAGDIAFPSNPITLSRTRDGTLDHQGSSRARRFRTRLASPMKNLKLHICEPPGQGDADAEIELVTEEKSVPTISVGSGESENPAETAGTPSSEMARATLWWRNTPVMNGRRIGTIGDFTAENADAA